MDGERLTLEGYRTWLQEKHEQGVKQVRITSALASLPGAEVDLTATAVNMKAEDAIKGAAGDSPATVNGQKIAGILVGTAEAAAILGVERPRIGRWRASGGDKLPEPVAELAAGPVWLRSEIEALRESTEARRKPRKAVEA